MNDFYNSYQDKLDPDQTEVQEEKTIEKIEPKDEGLSYESPSSKIDLFDEDESKEIEKGINYKNWIFISIFIVALLIISFFIYRGVTYVNVPSFDGWTKTQVQAWSVQNDVNIISEGIYNEEIKKGMVISQSTLGGESIKKNQQVNIVVSNGPDLEVDVVIPDFMTMDVNELNKWKDSNFMSNVRIIKEYSDEILEGNLISYEIKQDDYKDTVKRKSSIILVVSKGKEDLTKRNVTTPNFKTMTNEEIEEFSEVNYITINYVEEYNEVVPEGMMISQDVKVGKTIHPFDEVNISISKGKLVKMPSLYGLSKTQALNKISTLGITYEIIEEYSSTSKDGLIWQSIKKDAVIEEGMHLKLKYSLGSKVQIDSFVGGQFVSLQNLVKQYNSLGAKMTLKVTYTQNPALEGTILSQDIKNKIVEIGKTINVVVSSGELVSVPDFTAIDGATYHNAILREDAQALAESKGLIIVFVSEANALKLEGEVWHQNINVGQEVKKGSTITLKYNPIVSTVTLPDYSNMTEADLKLDPSYSKLKITFVIGEVTPGFGSGEVYSQTVNPGTTVQPSTEIILTVAP